jgi:hypothetical protein
MNTRHNLPRLLLAVAVFAGLTSCNRQTNQEPVTELKPKALPQTYGIYLVDAGKPVRLDDGSLTTPPRVSAKASFLIFDRRLSSGQADISRLGSVLTRRYIRKNVEHVLTSKDAPPTRVTITPANFYEAFGDPIPLDAGPVSQQPEMVRLTPRTPLPDGLYYFGLAEARYPFAVSLSEADGAAATALDKHYTTVDKNAPFSWDGFLARTQGGQTFNGNTVAKIEFKPPSALDAEAVEWKQSALQALEAGRLSESMIQTRKYLAYDPKDSVLPPKLAERFELEAKAAFAEQQFGAAVLLSRSGQEFMHSEPLTELRRKAEEALAQWNQQSAGTEKERTEAAAQTTPTKTVWTWTPTKGEEAGNDFSSFKVTDVGLFADYKKEKRYAPLVLPFDNVAGIINKQMSVRSEADFLKADEFPGLEISVISGGAPWLVFTSPERRDEAKQAIVAASTEWNIKHDLGTITCNLTDNGLLCYGVKAISGGWTARVSFPKGWRLAGIDRSYGFYAYDAATDKYWKDDDADLPLTGGQKFRFKSRGGGYDSNFKLYIAMP